MGLSLTFDAGGAWEIVASDGTHATVRSSVPSPPGSTLSGTAEGNSRHYRLKVRSCRRVDESELPYRIDGRLVDVTREQRAVLSVKAPPDRP